MEAKLREYRARRRREELLENAKEEIVETIEKVKDKASHFMPKILFTKMAKEKDDAVLLLEDENPIPQPQPPVEYEELDTESEEEPEAEPIPESWRYFITKWTIYSTIWITLWIYFLKVGFGAVFFVISLLIFIFVNTSTRRKRRGEKSAYSVFNKGCEKIDGTLDAEDLQRQMLFGMAGVRIG